LGNDVWGNDVWGNDVWGNIIWGNVVWGIAVVPPIPRYTSISNAMKVDSYAGERSGNLIAWHASQNQARAPVEGAVVVPSKHEVGEVCDKSYDFFNEHNHFLWKGVLQTPPFCCLWLLKLFISMNMYVSLM
jgi:hypothetical protein